MISKRVQKLRPVDAFQAQAVTQEGLASTSMPCSEPKADQADLRFDLDLQAFVYW